MEGWYPWGTDRGPDGECDWKPFSYEDWRPQITDKDVVDEINNAMAEMHIVAWVCETADGEAYKPNIELSAFGMSGHAGTVDLATWLDSELDAHRSEQAYCDEDAAELVGLKTLRDALQKMIEEREAALASQQAQKIEE